MAEKEYIEKLTALEALCKKWQTDDSFAEGLTVEQLDALSTAFRKIITVIETAPAADVVEVKHGRWKVRGQDVFCTNCNRESGYNAFGASAFSDYCPYCGADMRERKEDATD